MYRGRKYKGKRNNRQKRIIGGATKRTWASRGAKHVVDQKLAIGDVLDFGCGFGFDADHYGWDKYDPYYFPTFPTQKYDTIICVNVLNAITTKWRTDAVLHMRSLLKEDGKAYISVARNIPERGKVCDFKRAQHYVKLSLPVLFEDNKICVYVLDRKTDYFDLTKDCIVP